MRRCEGLLCLRQRLAFHSSLTIHEKEKIDFNSVSRATSNGSIDRLSDNIWYYGVAHPPFTTLEWFSGDTRSSSTTITSRNVEGDGALLSITHVSNAEAMDENNVKVSEDAEVWANFPLESQERSRFKQCAFYVEDEVLGHALLIETETPSERDQWVQCLREGLSFEKNKDEHEMDAQKAGEDVMENVEARLSSPVRSNVSVRSLLHQGKSENLMEEEDPFGLLSLTSSALSSFKNVTSKAAPGMFAMDHLGLVPRCKQVGNNEVTADSDAIVDTIELDGAANTAVVSPSLLTLGRQQSGQLIASRERSCSNGTYSLRLSMVAELARGKKIRRHSVGAMLGLSSGASRGCLRCCKKFGYLIHTAKTCASCVHRFCRDHCNQYTALTLPESNIRPSQELVGSQVVAADASELKRVCMDCFVRQQLLTALHEAVVYYASVVDEAGGLPRLVRWKYFDQGPKLEIEIHIRARSLGPLTLLSAMFKYRQQPFMFVVVLAQLVHNVENCLDTMDFYWPQFLQWGFTNLSDASPSVRVFYLFFLTATVRRSVHLAVKATWECIAAHWDAMAGELYERGNAVVVMLFFVTNVNFGETRSVLPQLLFPQAPAHQRESLSNLLEQLYEFVRRTYAVSQRESPFFEWLLARSKEEVVVSSRHVRKQLSTCDGVLDPFPTDYYEEAQLMILERRRSGIEHLVETKQRIWSKPTQRVFSDQVRLVRFLVDLCTYLKENILEPLQRKKSLPVLLQEMLRGKHIRPDAALPLAGTMARAHRVVNVLTNEGTVFSTKARAPTLVFFEIISSSVGCEDESCEIVDSVHDERNLDAATGNEMTDVTERRQEEITDYLDGEFIGTYMADLIPVSQSAPQSSSRSSNSEDLDDFDQTLPAGCTPLSEKTNGDTFARNESDDDAVDDTEISSANGMQVSSSFHSTNASKAFECPFFGERFAETQKRIRESSTFAHYDGWALVPLIAKSFDDMRQEVFVLQGLKLFQLIFRKHNLDLWMRYYHIVCAGKDCGLLEVITDAQSVDSLKKKGTKVHGIGTSLAKIFERACGRDPLTGKHDSIRLESARANFITSMAAYSLFCYVFLVKDRHNGNIMLSTEGHVMHIDFGFVLGIAPGNTFSLETAPFKLTPEMVEIMGTEGFERYRQLVAQGLLALHLEASQLLSLVYLSSKDSSFPCFKGQSRARVVQRLSHRLCIGKSVHDIERAAARIVDKSNRHRGTRQYDWFQNISNGILP